MRKLNTLQVIPEKVQRGSSSFLYTVRQNKNLVDSFDPTKKKPELTFPGYNSDNLKEGIRALADGCCGYCGGRLDGKVTVVVEHYRPKKELRFQETPLSPHQSKKVYNIDSSGNITKCSFGYYQFGDDALNMIPSCPACNSGQGKGKNTGTYISKKTKDGLKLGFLDKNITYGKNNFFPLYGIKRINGHLVDIRYSTKSIDDITNERPLLFNPYTDEPDDLFEYKKIRTSSCTKHIYIQIRPKKSASKFKRLKAECSISLLGLNRKELCHTRACHYENLKKLNKEIHLSKQQLQWEPLIWAKFCSEYARYFDRENSELIGFSKGKYSHLAIELREIIIKNVSCCEISIFTTNVSFFEIINEFKDFSFAVEENPRHELQEEFIDTSLKKI
jgi:hypothetical protein